MGRSFVIPGEAMVEVKGNGALCLSGAAPNGQLCQLGLSVDEIRVIPSFVHHDIRADDYGTEIPAEIMWMLADVRISMLLNHVDQFVLDAVLAESMAGGVEQDQDLGWAGYMAPAGTLMGGNRALHTPGNHYTSLNIRTPVQGYPWNFPAAYLTGPPIEIPLGVNVSQYRLNWRAIPYSYYVSVDSEIRSSGVPLWTRVLDTP